MRLVVISTKGEILNVLCLLNARLCHFDVAALSFRLTEKY
jgi:hypothetical protein